jgi:hypothetical protein
MKPVEARAHLERRLAELEREIEFLKLALSLIDEALVKRSFTRSSELHVENARAALTQQAP